MATSRPSADSEEEELFHNSISITLCHTLTSMSKKKQEEKLSEIYSACCALINSHGGTMTLSLENGDISDAKELERRIYQKFNSVFGYTRMRDAIHRTSLSASEIVFEVIGMSDLCTLHYNMYVPTELQTVPLQSAKEIKKILQPKRIIEIDNMVKANAYEKDLVSGKPLPDNSPGLESKTKQYKFLKAEKKKRTKLGDRMIKEENRIDHYVSAFGNHHGGHIYYGVSDDGIVRGELVTDRDEIIRKVDKAMNKIIWSSDDEVGGKLKPIRGQHWDIFFEPVKNESGQTINKTFVIIVYISYYSGGVFTNEPESYQLVDGKVVSIPFQEWKIRVLRTACAVHSIGRSDFTTTKSQNTYYRIMEEMMDIRNQGDGNGLTKYISDVNKQYKTTNVHLSTLSQTATYAFRLGDFLLAEEIIKEYDCLHTQCEENMLVPVSMGLYIKSANKRARGEYQESYELAINGRQMTEGLAPGLIQAWFCTHTALLANILANEETNSARREELVQEAKRLLGIALDYSNHVKASGKFTKAVVDLQQKVYIHLSELYLGFSLSGSLASKHVSFEDVSSARNCLHQVGQLEREADNKYKLSPLRNVQYLLALSALFLRQFQLGVSERVPEEISRGKLTSSLEKCDEALELATSNKFQEMIRYCLQLRDQLLGSRLTLNLSWIKI